MSKEWRISWRRTTWSPRTDTKSRHFQRRLAAKAFYDRLTNSAGRPDLGHALVEVHQREVGPWEPTVEPWL